MRKRIVTLLLSALLPCNLSLAETMMTGAYTEAETYLATTGQNLHFAPSDLKAATIALAEQFTQSCGDTFCSGDFSNLHAIEWSCTIRQVDAVLGQCIWIFAGSYVKIDRVTGALMPVARTFVCHLPVTGTVQDLMSFFQKASVMGDSGHDGLTQTKLPGSERTLNEVLLGCLGG